jgi:hypothetical protein
MDPKLCRELNLMSLELLADYMTLDFDEVKSLYQELRDDREFLDGLNEMIQYGRTKYQQGIFRHESIDSVDWMSIQRIILYILVRKYQPEVCLETGVFYGGNTAFILNALKKKQNGQINFNRFTRK